MSTDHERVPWARTAQLRWNAGVLEQLWTGDTYEWTNAYGRERRVTHVHSEWRPIEEKAP